MVEISPGWPLATRVAFSGSKMAAKMAEIVSQNLSYFTTPTLRSYCI